MPGDNNDVGNSFNQQPTGKTDSPQTSSLVSVLGMTLPDIGEKVIDVSKQFQAILATSRMQKDYEMAKNLVQIIENNKDHENYEEMLIVAILNQSELFEFKKEIKKEFSFEKDDRGEELWESLKQIIQTNKDNLDNIPIENIFRKTYPELLANYAVSSRSLNIIEECIVFLKSNSTEETLSSNIIYDLEEIFMKNSVEFYDNEISSIFADKIRFYYDDHMSPLEMDVDPDYTFPKAISSFTESYIVNPEFTSEYSNKIARSQIWKYFMIRNNIENLSSNLMKSTGKHESQLEEIFMDNENSKKSESVFNSVLKENSLSEAEIEEKILSGLKSIVYLGEDPSDEGEDLPF